MLAEDEAMIVSAMQGLVEAQVLAKLKGKAERPGFVPAVADNVALCETVFGLADAIKCLKSSSSAVVIHGVMDAPAGSREGTPSTVCVRLYVTVWRW